MSLRDDANTEAFRRMCSAEPVLFDILPALDALPGLRRNHILTSGPVLPWTEYEGGQRAALIGGAMFEGLASSEQEAEEKFSRGEIEIGACAAFDCLGSLAGIYTPSMPVLAVRNANGGNVAYCNFYEGTNPRRLNYGVYDEGVRQRLLHVQDVVAPVIRKAVLAVGGVPLRPIMQRALHMGDELHSRNTAASLLFARELFPALLDLNSTTSLPVLEALEALTADHYFFLRLSMAAAKTMVDAAHGVPGSSVVTGMGFNCRRFAIRVSGLGSKWFDGPLPIVRAKLFPGHTEDEIAWMGGESVTIEAVGLGGFAQAAAFPLQAYQGGSATAMVENNVAMYAITVGEHPHFRIPFLDYRGVPTGIDVVKVVETGITPVMDIGIAGRGGGQIGAGLVRAHQGCFQQAADTYMATYPV